MTVDTRRTLPELFVVLSVPMVVFLGSWLLQVARAGVQPVEITDRLVIDSLLVQGAIAAVLLPWLYRRGWTPARAAGSPEPRDVLRGLGAWLAVMGSVYVAIAVAYLVAPEWARAIAAREVSGALSPAVAAIAPLGASLFEEFLWLGYTVPALEPRVGLRAACLASVVLRVVVHAYQGPVILVTVLPAALAFTAYYAVTRRLWPVVVAHVVIDALAMSTLVAPTS